MKKTLLLSLLLLVGRFSFVNAQETTNELKPAVVKSDDDVLKFLKNITLGVCVQAQWQYAQEKGMDGGPASAGEFSPNRDSRIMLRRGYLRLGYNSKYFSSLVQINAVPSGVSLVNAYVEVNTASKSVAFRAGNIYKHFGYFTSYASSARLTPENTRGDQTLFIDLTGVGGRLQLRDIRDKWTRYFTLNLSYFTGDNMASDTYANSDFIGKLEYAKSIGKFTLGAEFSTLQGTLINVSDNSYSFVNGRYVAKTDVGGKSSSRAYYSIGANIGMVSCAGETKIFSEYVLGNQLGTAKSNISPKRNFNAKATDALYGREFSNYYIFAQHRIAKTNATIIARYDAVNPNNKISRDEIGVVQGSSSADVRYSTFGFGAYYKCFKYVSVSAYYEIVKNEKCPNLQGFQSDRKDNLFTLRLQCAF